MRGYPVSIEGNLPIFKVSDWLGDAPRSLLDEISKIKSGDVVLPIKDAKTGQMRDLSVRCITEPDQAQKLMFNRLGVQMPKRLGSRMQNPKCSEDF